MIPQRGISTCYKRSHITLWEGCLYMDGGSGGLEVRENSNYRPLSNQGKANRILGHFSSLSLSTSSRFALSVFQEHCLRWWLVYLFLGFMD